MRFLLAGGGTAGHVNPLLALAEALRADGHEAVALGTAEGLEQRLVPQRNFELLTVPRLPLPRKLSFSLPLFPFRLWAAAWKVRGIIKQRKFDAVVGFGGYASAPAYLGAKLAGVPIVVHEANAKSGFANRLGARLGAQVGVAFGYSDITGAALVGMPLRSEILASVAGYDRQQARVELGLDPMLPTLLVTGGSLGARRLNLAVIAALGDLLRAGIQVLHIVGENADLEPLVEPGYLRLSYCDRMDAAIAASDFAISRAGASTVSEFTACGLPAAYVPYPVGNGEQRFNALGAVEAGAAIMCPDQEFDADFIRSRVIPLVSHQKSLNQMSVAAMSIAIPDGTERLKQFVLAAVDTSSRDKA